MKKIKLNMGYTAIVDDEDYERVCKYSWFVEINNGNVYATARSIDESTTRIKMHRLIIEASKGVLVDHKNGDGLDNRKNNLRLCSPLQNAMNARIRKDNTSTYKGVTWHSRINKWQVRIQHKHKRLHLGYFDDIKIAAKIYNETAICLFGEFAYLNAI